MQDIEALSRTQQKLGSDAALGDAITNMRRQLEDCEADAAINAATIDTLRQRLVQEERRGARIACRDPLQLSHIHTLVKTTPLIPDSALRRYGRFMRCRIYGSRYSPC